MMLPTIHLNGTGREALATGYRVAYGSVGDALRSMEEAAPNARDYYVLGSGAFVQACREHKARVAALVAVRDDLLALYESVAWALLRPRPGKERCHDPSGSGRSNRRALQTV